MNFPELYFWTFLQSNKNHFCGSRKWVGIFKRSIRIRSWIMGPDVIQERMLERIKGDLKILKYGVQWTLLNMTRSGPAKIVILSGFFITA